MEIRILTSLEDAEKYRSIRLESLQNSPESFASSYEEEKDFSIEKFKDQFNRMILLHTGLLRKMNLLESLHYMKIKYIN